MVRRDGDFTAATDHNWRLRYGVCFASTQAMLVLPVRPGSLNSIWYADIVWLAFVVVQALDGGMSYIGILTLGPGIEANPLVAWFVHAFGPATALWGAKLLAVGCGVMLYLTARHATLALLTLFYVVCAVIPWGYVLRPYV